MTMIFLGLAALLAAVAVVLIIGFVLHWGHKREQGLMPYVFYPTLFIIALTTLLSGRDLYVSEFVDSYMIKPPLLVWATRANSLFMLFAACERIARRFLYSGYKPDAPILLMAGFWAYYLTNIASSALLGSHSSFSHEYFYSFAAGSAALLCPAQEGLTAVRAVRNALFIFILLSAAMIVIRPESVISPYEGGLIHGLTIRYFGLAPHANVFGPLIVVFLICLWSSPYSSRWINLLAWIIGWVSLTLTQSKTSWIGMAICASCIGYFRYGDFIKQRIFDFRRPQVAATLLIMAMLSTLAIGIVVMFTESGDSVSSFFMTREGDKLLSLTGRDEIWKAAVREWRHNPVFGYGLTLWDEHYRAQIGILAYHSHSQFYQSLASSGIVGVVGLLIYAMTLFLISLKTASSSGGLSMALFMILFIRSITEVPLAIETLGPEIMPHLILQMVLAAHLAPQNVVNLALQTPAAYKFVSPRGVA